MQLPPGSRVWQALGGPLAWAQQDYWNSQLFHALNIANWQRSENGRKGKNAPEVPKPPLYSHEKRRQQKIMDRKAERFQKRMQTRQQLAIEAPAERGPVTGTE